MKRRPVRNAVRYSFVMIAAAFCGGVSSFGQTTTFQVAAATGQAGITSIQNSTSINDSGQIAFVGNLSVGQAVYVATGENNPVNITTGFQTANRSFRDTLQINNSGKVGVVDRVTGGTTGTLARIWDGTGNPGAWTTIAQGISPNTISGFFDILGSFAALSDDGNLAFAGLEGSEWEIHLSSSFVDSRDAFSLFSEVSSAPSGSFFRFRAADGEIAAVGNRTSGTTTIVHYDLSGFDTVTGIAGTAGGTWNDLGVNIGLSDDGRAVAFYGDLSTTGATALNTTSGPGIFLNYATGSGRTTVRLSGLANNGQLDPGERWDDSNTNGVVDAGEDKGGISTYDRDSPVSVNLSGSEWEAFRVGFHATKNGGNASYYTARFRPGDTPAILAAPVPVVAVAQQIPNLGGTVTAVSAMDGVNSAEQFAMHVTTSGGQDLVLRATQVVDPLRQTHIPWGDDLYAPSQLNSFITRLSNGTAENPADVAFAASLTAIRNRGAYNLARRGCLISSYAMALRALDLADLNPSELYATVEAAGGIDEIKRIMRSPSTGQAIVGSGGIPAFIGADLDHQVLNQLFPSLSTVETTSTSDVVTALQEGKKVLLNVKNGGHWVFANGLTDQKIEVIDPGSDNNDRAYTQAELSSLLKFKKARILGTTATSTGVLQTHSPVEVVLTSPSGKRLGFNPLTNIAFNEIANSSYLEQFPLLDPDAEYSDTQASEGDPFITHVGFLNGLELGDYSLQVFGVENGAYSVDFSAFIGNSQLTNATFSGNITMGATQTFMLTVGGGLTGDFNGNGSVDTADYIVWRNGLGSTYTQNDYNAWRSHFGQTSGSGGSIPVQVPELESIWLSLMYVGAYFGRRPDRG